MTYYSASTGDAASVQAQMRTTVPSHSAWSLVESATANSGSYPTDVYKCDHAVSGLSADFYVAVIYNGSSALYLGIAEGYNASTHKPQRPAVAATSALQTLQADGGILAATTEIDWYSGFTDPGGGTVSVVGSKVMSSSFAPYAIIVAKDALILISVSGLIYAGAYATDLGADDPLPIMIGSSASPSCYATRHPRRGGLATGYACNLNGAASGDTSGGLLSGSSGFGGVPEANSALWQAPGSGAAGDGYDSYQIDFPASRVAVLNSYVSGSATIGRYVNGWRRGWFKHIRKTAGSFAALDRLTIDGTDYVSAGLNGLWIEKDPA